MADTSQSTTNPLAPGLATSEGRLTLAAQVAGFVIATYGGILARYAGEHPDLRWPAVAVMLVGVVLSAATLFGYQKGRAVVKSMALQQLIDLGAPATVALLEQLVLKKPAPPTPVAPVGGMAGELSAAVDQAFRETPAGAPQPGTGAAPPHPR
jgi:hypothetical protein